MSATNEEPQEASRSMEASASSAAASSGSEVGSVAPAAQPTTPTVEQLQKEKAAAEHRAEQAEEALAKLQELHVTASDGAPLDELERMVVSSSERAVTAAAKAKDLAAQLQSAVDGQSAAEKELAALRNEVQRHLGDASSENDDGAASTVELLRVLLSKRTPRPATAASEASSSSSSSSAASSSASSAESASDAPTSVDAEALQATQKRNAALKRKIQELEERNESAVVGELQHRAMGLAAKLRSASSRAAKAERAADVAESRVDALSQHVEKLMTHLEHEAGAKSKLHDQLRKAEITIQRLKARGLQLARANQERERLVLQLKEGAKILEDQLRLMDQKYVELRGKLDWLRSRADKEVRKARKQAEVVERAWLELQASGVIPISRKPPKMPAKRLMVGDPPGMPGADIPPYQDPPAPDAAAAASSSSAAPRLPAIPSSRSPGSIRS